MIADVIVRPLAEADVREAAFWYESKREGLGVPVIIAVLHQPQTTMSQTPRIGSGFRFVIPAIFKRESMDSCTACHHLVDARWMIARMTGLYPELVVTGCQHHFRPAARAPTNMAIDPDPVTLSPSKGDVFSVLRRAQHERCGHQFQKRIPTRPKLPCHKILG